jgi:hypothetical protein
LRAGNSSSVVNGRREHVLQTNEYGGGATGSKEQTSGCDICCAVERRARHDETMEASGPARSSIGYGCLFGKLHCFSLINRFDFEAKYCGLAGTVVRLK